MTIESGPERLGSPEVLPERGEVLTSDSERVVFVALKPTGAGPTDRFMHQFIDPMTGHYRFFDDMRGIRSCVPTRNLRTGLLVCRIAMDGEVDLGISERADEDGYSNWGMLTPDESPSQDELQLQWAAGSSLRGGFDDRWIWRRPGSEPKGDRGWIFRSSAT